MVQTMYKSEVLYVVLHWELWCWVGSSSLFGSWRCEVRNLNSGIRHTKITGTYEGG
jgi:hypothetical protein